MVVVFDAWTVLAGLYGCASSQCTGGVLQFRLKMTPQEYTPGASLPRALGASSGSSQMAQPVASSC